MKTLVLKITGDAKNDEAAIAKAAEIIRNGGTVAFPTETVYGLGANALRGESVQKIYAAKGRPSWNPLIVHVSSRDMLNSLVTDYPQGFDKLAAKFMPGPLTFLLPKSDKIPDEVSAGRNDVAVRMPKHEIARKLIEAAGVPIAAPSANRSGRTSPTSAEHVLEDLDGRIDAVLDGGTCDVGVESTVINLMAQPPMILRPGGVSKEAIEETLGMPVTLFEKSAEGTDVKALPSPGMMLRHYAPNAKLYNIEGDKYALFAAADKAAKEGNKVGVLLPSDWQLPENIKAEVYDYGTWGDWDTMARRVFAGLRGLDRKKVDVIFAPMPPKEGLGLAIRDRLLRAAK